MLRRLLFVVCISLGLSAVVRAQEVDETLVREGQAVIEALRADDAAAIESRFTEPLRTAASHERFSTSLAEVRFRYGALRSCGPPQLRSTGLWIVEYRCDFAVAPMTLRLVWLRKETPQLAGLFVLPAPPVAAPLPSGLREEGVTTGAAGWPLPGTLLVPANANPPVAVLVHGSGPNDRDETIGPNKPFRDLAIGLASHGIATLRYDKRTFVHRARLVDEVPQYTLDDEIVDDAVAALVMVGGDPRFGPVFVIGHSEGAWLAPRIAARAKAAGVPIAGIVMLAGNVTPLADLLVRQMEFLASLPSSLQSAPVTPATVDEAQRQRDDVDLLVANGRVQPGHEELPFGQPASIWLDIGRYDPAATLLADPSLPALLTFGERDYQVPASERDLWSRRLGPRADATLVVMPGLDHLLMKTTGAMGPATYRKPRQVDPSLIDLVARWIATHAVAAR